MRFDRRAADYERHAIPQARVVARLAELIPDAESGETALEVGAGTGLLTRRLLAKGWRVTATDLSPAMVAAGREGVPGADWRVLDAFAAPETTCRHLFSANLLQWADDPTTAFARLAARLAPGGRMTHAILVDPTLRELRALAGDNASPVRWRTPDVWIAAATAAGLRVSRTATTLFTVAYPDARALLADLHRSGAVGETPRRGAGALRELLRRYDATQAAPGGGVTATWAALLLTADR